MEEPKSWIEFLGLDFSSATQKNNAQLQLPAYEELMRRIYRLPKGGAPITAGDWHQSRIYNLFGKLEELGLLGSLGFLSGLYGSMFVMVPLIKVVLHTATGDTLQRSEIDAWLKKPLLGKGLDPEKILICGIKLSEFPNGPALDYSI